MPGWKVRIHLAIGCTLIAAGVMGVGVAAAQPAGGGAKDPLKLFEPIYPVFTSARCANCHGAVDPINGINHDKIEEVPLDAGNMLPGRDGNSQCLECHDESADTSVWRLAPSQLSFGDKAPLELCRQVRDDNGLRDGDAARFQEFINHLSGDQLIGFAFEGRRAMVDNDPQPPPMTRAQFVSFAQRWLQEGKAKCSTWNGTISQHIVSSVAPNWDITVDISVKDGDASAEVHGTGHQHVTGQACYVRDDTFSIDSGNTLIPTDLTVQLNRDLPSAPGAPSVQGLPPGIPALPPGVPALPPGVPLPTGLGGDPNGYALILRMPPIDSNDHWEQVDPPGCGRTTRDDHFQYQYISLQITKVLDPKNPDHLKDTDVQTSPGGTVTTTWDLTRE